METPSDPAKRLRDLANILPGHTEIARLLKSIDDPASDEASKDRYVAIVAASAVEGALRLALAHNIEPQRRSTFYECIESAATKAIVTDDQKTELHRIRDIRNVFAHALVPISFSTPEVVELTTLFWHHPIADWASYFSTIFPPRQRFAIVCGAFFDHLTPKT